MFKQDELCLTWHSNKIMIHLFCRSTYKKVFETVRSASRVSCVDPNQFPRIGSMTTSTLSSNSAGPRMSCGQIRPQAVSSMYPSLDSAGESEGSLFTESEDYPYVSLFYSSWNKEIIKKWNKTFMISKNSIVLQRATTNWCSWCSWCSWSGSRSTPFNASRGIS